MFLPVYFLNNLINLTSLKCIYVCFNNTYMCGKFGIVAILLIVNIYCTYCILVLYTYHVKYPKVKVYCGEKQGKAT